MVPSCVRSAASQDLTLASLRYMPKTRRLLSAEGEGITFSSMFATTPVCVAHAATFSDEARALRPFRNGALSADLAPLTGTALMLRPPPPAAAAAAGAAAEQLRSAALAAHPTCLGCTNTTPAASRTTCIPDATAPRRESGRLRRWQCTCRAQGVRGAEPPCLALQDCHTRAPT